MGNQTATADPERPVAALEDRCVMVAAAERTNIEGLPSFPVKSVDVLAIVTLQLVKPTSFSGGI